MGGRKPNPWGYHFKQYVQNDSVLSILLPCKCSGKQRASRRRTSHCIRGSAARLGSSDRVYTDERCSLPPPYSCGARDKLKCLRARSAWRAPVLRHGGRRHSGERSAHDSEQHDGNDRAQKIKKKLVYEPPPSHDMVTMMPLAMHKYTKCRRTKVLLDGLCNPHFVRKT